MNITINARGLELIAAWLADHHVNGTELTADNIRAWAAEAEQNAGNGNGAYFELRAHESIYGRPEIFDVPAEGFDRTQSSSDINSYVVDEGGYVVSTLSRAKALQDALASVVSRLSASDLDAAIENIFGEATDAQQERDNIALSLERSAKAALTLASILRAPQVDERQGDKIGFDADH